MNQESKTPRQPVAQGSQSGAAGRRKGQSVLQAAGIMAGVGALTKIASFMREAALASKFGAGQATDEFLAAGTIPIVAMVVVVGALSTAAVPVLAQRLAASDDRNELRGEGLAPVAGALVGGLMLVGLVVSLLLFALAGPLVHLLSPGFGPGDVAGAAGLLRVLAPMGLFLAITAALTPILWVRSEFTSPALGSFTNSAVVVLLLLGLSGTLGIRAAAWGYVLAAVVQVSVLVLGVLWLRQRLALRLWHPALGEIGRLLLPVLISAGALQLGLVVTRILGSYLDAGGITHLNYATRVAQLPIGIFSAAIVTAIYPRLATGAREPRAFGQALGQGLRLCLFVVLPLALGAWLFRQEVVALLFEHGKFTATQSAATARALGALAPGVVAITIWDLSQRAFFARRESWPPVVVAVISVLLTAGLGMLLLPSLDAVGVALAVSAGQVLAALSLVIWLQRRTGALANQGLGGWIARLAFAALLAGVIGGLAQWLLPHLLPGTSMLHQAVRLALAGGLFLGVYAFGGYALGIAEVRQAIGKVRRKLGRR